MLSVIDAEETGGCQRGGNEGMSEKAKGSKSYKRLVIKYVSRGDIIYVTGNISKNI